ncbi:hypothetical protein SCHPADRAFT_940103 [Schizopora paradoxa]|uniref:Uncharacterized protein n=1 Tax=Schizopora paradoxa TaxID=27342 RepID=A0A0H2RWG7_9AGAM|nr:hypothetical protein SCHPADRAFT_940103 [Schizopora paradoxa]
MTGDEGPDDQAVNLQLPNTLQNHQPIAQPSSYNIAPSNIATSAYPMAPHQTAPAKPYGYVPNFSNGQSYPAGYMPYMGGTTGFPAYSNDVVTTTNYNGQFPPSAPNDYQNYMSGNPTTQYYMPQGP